MKSSDGARIDAAPGSLGIALAFAVTAFAAGVFFRLWDLGGAPLAVDEYYLGMSVLNVAERGIPEFACGGFYHRGLLLQYLSVPLLWLGAELELAIRFWPVVASVIAIFAVWRIGLLAGGLMTAALAAGFASLSLWEVEFGRFGRMYAPFQALFLWYVYFHIQHLVFGRRRAAWWYLSLSAITPFVYEGAAILLVLNFLHVIWPTRRWTIGTLTAAIGLFVAGIGYLKFDFSRVSQAAAAAIELPRATIDVLTRPPIELPIMPATVAPILLAGVAACAVFVWLNRSNLRLHHPSVLYWAFAAMAFCFGLVALGLALLAVGLVLRLPSPVSDTETTDRRRFGWLAVFLAGWLVLVAGTFIVDGTDPIKAVRQALRYTLDYPDVFYKIVLPWVRTIPMTAVLLAAAALPSLLAARAGSRASLSDAAYVVRYLFALLILLALGVAILPQPYDITRYTYFLYPLVLVLAANGIAVLAERAHRTHSWSLAVPAACVGTLFLFAEDFRLVHLAQINELEFRYRTTYGPALAEHYYPRWDFRGAAAYVNERLGSADSVIVFDMPMPYYLRRTSAIFIREGTSVHSNNVVTCDGARDRWSSAPVVDHDEALYRLVDEAPDDVWLVLRTASYRWRDPLEQVLPQRYGVKPLHTTQDGRLAVYRVTDLDR